MAALANISLNTSDTYYDGSFADCSNHYFTDVMLLVILIIIVVGIIANCFTFGVFWKGNFKSSTSFLFLSLALVDSAVLIILSLGFVESVGAVNCVAMFQIAKTATIWVTVLIAVNRYIIVCRPLMASRWCTVSKVRIQLALVLLAAVLCNIPHFLPSRFKNYPVTNGTAYNTRVVPTKFGEERLFYRIYDYIMVDVLMMGVPLLILTVLTIRLIKAMNDHRRMQLQMKSQLSRLDSNVTFALIIVVVVFIICHVPIVLLTVTGYFEYNSMIVECYLTRITLMFLLLNSAVNFFIYILSNQAFRAVLI